MDGPDLPISAEAPPNAYNAKRANEKQNATKEQQLQQQQQQGKQIKDRGKHQSFRVSLTQLNKIDADEIDKNIDNKSGKDNRLGNDNREGVGDNQGKKVSKSGRVVEIDTGGREDEGGEMTCHVFPFMLSKSFYALGHLYLG